MNALDYIGKKYNLNLNQRRQPIEIPNTTRETFAELLSELKFNLGAEVGVERGLYSEVLLKKNSMLYLDSIDCWEAYEGYRDHMTQAEMDELYEDTEKRLAPFEERSRIIKGYSVPTADQFEDESLDFVYLDANHDFEHVVEDIAAWEKKVKVGGIVSGHDYIRRKTNAFLMHVPYAIDAYVSAYQIRPLFVLGRKDARANNNPKRGELRDSTRSWFYVKPQRPPMIPGYKQTLDNEK